MKASDIISLARNEYLGDSKTPYLWSDTTLLANLNDAEREANERAELIRDKNTLSDAYDLPVCSITLVSGQSEYAISQNITRINELILSSTGEPIAPVTEKYLEVLWPTWRTATGTPVCCLIEKGKIRFIPEPDASDTVTLDVIRNPLNDLKLTAVTVTGSSNISFVAATKTISMPTGNFILAGLRPGSIVVITGTTSNNKTVNVEVCNKTTLKVTQSLTDEADKSATLTADSVPEISESYHKKLIDFMCYLAYHNRDLNTSDGVSSDTHDKRFTRNFGPRPSARALQCRMSSPRHFKRIMGRPFGST